MLAPTLPPPLGDPMSKMIFVSLPVADLAASTAFYQALGFTQNMQFSDASSACSLGRRPGDALSHAAQLHRPPVPPAHRRPCRH
jgi:hypothetical protein